jgi:SAM-dependent methyltransferase
VSDDGRGLKFGTVAEMYDRYRPGPPPEAATLLGDLAGLDVLEVGAGTGKFTRFLLALGANVSVIEPDADMLAVLLRSSPNVNVLAGRAEAIPLADASVDAALSSSAWHWFKQPDAADEFARVLKDDGQLFVFWNTFSKDDAFTNSLKNLRRLEGDVLERPRGWSANFDAVGAFVDAHDVSLDWTWTRPIEDAVALFGTYSNVIMQSDEDRRIVLDRVRTQITDHVGAASEVSLAMTLRGSIARRRPR